MRARDVSVSLTDNGDGTIKIWCATFKLKDTLPRAKDGRVDPNALRRKQKQIEQLIGLIDFPSKEETP